MAAEMSGKAGRVIGDDEVAIKYLAEQLLANEVHVNRLIQPGARAADFDAAINTQAWHVPATIGELRPLELDFLAKRLQFPLEGGKVIKNANELRAALADGSIKWDKVQDALEFVGAHPDYIRRVQRAVEFSWDGFWAAAAKRFSLSRHEKGRLQQMMVRSAEVRGMKPVEYVSQVFSPMIAAGTEATIEELGKAVSILRAPTKAAGTPEMLMTQLADVFTAHLDPSAQRTLENLRGGWSLETNGAFARRVLAMLDGAGEADPDIIRAVQQFSKWSQSALRDGLLSAGSPNPYSDLLTRVAGIETDLAAPFNHTEQMLVNQAMEAMRLKEQDAFRLQYFSRERSWLERSINHPFFGIYPASYMWGKIAPEMIRFIAKEPFGIQTGALAYTLNDVQSAVAVQREFDPEFDEIIEGLGHSQAIWFAGYLLPAVPWDVGAALPSWMRDIAAQGLANQRRVADGEEPKAIDLGRPVRKVADYVSPFRSVFQIERVAEEVLAKGEPVDPAPASPGSAPIGPLRATELGPTLEEQMAELRDVFQQY